MKVVLIVLGTLAALALLVLGGIAAMAWWFFGAIEDAVLAELETQPTFVERVGVVESFDMILEEEGNFSFTAARGSGTVHFKPGEADEEGRAVVTLDNGDTFEVPFSQAALQARIDGQFGRQPAVSGEVDPTESNAPRGPENETGAVEELEEPAKSEAPENQPAGG